MFDFEFLSPTKLVVGAGAVEEVGRLVREQGASRVLIHYGSRSERVLQLLGRVRGILQDAGVSVAELGGVVPNPRLSLVYEGIELCRRENIDFILAVGGGSVIDSSKAIAIGVPYEGDVWNFFAEENGEALDVPKVHIPIGVVLTIAAAGSEASNSCVITNEKEQLKRFCDNDVHRAAFAIEDPELTMSLPAFQTACGITDIMSHSMERYFTPHGTENILTDRLCEAIFKTCMDCARVLMDDPQNYEARRSIMLASTLSHNGLTGMGRTGDWASHFIEHELSGEFDVTHGAGLAVITPAWMKYTWRENPEIFLKWATRVMGVETDYEKPERTILEAIRRLEDFFHSIGLPTRIREMPEVGEIDEAVMYKMAARVRKMHGDGTVGNLKRLNTEDVVNIYKLAL